MRSSIQSSSLLAALFLVLSSSSYAQQLRSLHRTLPEKEVSEIKQSLSATACPVVVDTMFDNTYEEIKFFDYSVFDGGKNVNYSQDHLRLYRNAAAIRSTADLPASLHAAYTEEMLSSPIKQISPEFNQYLLDNGYEIGPDGNDVNGQTQIQRFLALESVELRLTYTGKGLTKERFTLGYYYYPKSLCKLERLFGNDQVTFVNLFELNEDRKGSTKRFTIPQDHYFGFYFLEAGGVDTRHRFSEAYYTENKFNFDNADVLADDTQRPDYVTDHFLVIADSKGLNLMIEESQYFAGSKSLGVQNYVSALFDQLKCSDGRLIDIQQNFVDACHSFSGSEAGLETIPVTPLRQANKMLRAHSKQSFSLSGPATSSSRGVGKSNSSLKALFDRISGVSSSFNFAGSAGAEASSLITDFVPETGPGGAAGTDVTPHDIPLITNADYVLAVDYDNAAGERIATVFSNETSSQVYNHSKGSCDRYHGIQLRSLENLVLNGAHFYMGRLYNPRTNEKDYSILFSAFEKVAGNSNTLTVRSTWVPDDFGAIPSGSKVYNFQVYGKTKANAIAMAQLVLSTIASKVTSLEYENLQEKKLSAIIQSVNIKNNKIHLQVRNLLNVDQNAKFVTAGLRYTQDNNYQPLASQQEVLKPGINYVEIERDKVIFDGQVYMQDLAEPSRDVVFVTSGSYGAYHQAGSSGSFDTNGCRYEDANSNDKLSLKLPGCANFSGQGTSQTGIFRTLINVDVHLYDHMQFYLGSNSNFKVCLEGEVEGSWFFSCVFKDATVDGRKEIIKIPLSEFFNGEEPDAYDLAGMTAINFLLDEPSSDRQFAVEQLEFLKLNFEWNLVSIKNAEMLADPNLGFGEYVHDNLILWSMQADGQWHCWSPEFSLAELQSQFQANCIDTISQFELGKAYWASSRTGVQSFGYNYKDNPGTLTLSSGWNMISFYGDYADVASAIKAELKLPRKAIVDQIWTYDNNKWSIYVSSGSVPEGYDPIESISSKRGYFIYVK